MGKSDFFEKSLQSYFRKLFTSTATKFSTSFIFCLLFPGEPLPSVEWYMDNEPIDQTFQQTYEGVVKNDLTIRHLKREHTLSRLRCLAKNNNLTKPVETSVTLKMLCKYPCYSCTLALKISKKCKFRQDGTTGGPRTSRKFVFARYSKPRCLHLY